MSPAALPPEQQEFQEYARRWLAENVPPLPPERLPISPIEVMTTGQRDYLQAWQRKCYDVGLVGADYPTEYGGGGHEGFQRIANQELGLARVPFLINIVGLNMAAPTILAHGTDEQKQKFIPGCLSGDEIWCQGFSEPGAGSDMANQQTSAVPDGGIGHISWVLAQRPGMGVMLNPDEEPRRGLTPTWVGAVAAAFLGAALLAMRRSRGPRTGAG